MSAATTRAEGARSAPGLAIRSLLWAGASALLLLWAFRRIEFGR